MLYRDAEFTAAAVDSVKIFMSAATIDDVRGDRAAPGRTRAARGDENCLRGQQCQGAHYIMSGIETRATNANAGSGSKVARCPDAKCSGLE